MTSRAFAALFLTLILCAWFTVPAHASRTNGTIDPRDKGSYLVRFFDAPDTGVAGADSRINFGKFSMYPSASVRITDDGITGYLWSEIAGWVVTNCADTTSGCTAANSNFKIAVAPNGVLSGFAWGENTGWINFGPFTLASVPQVQISKEGLFGGTNGSDAGYAWSENFGWIVFDCSVASTCLVTDYVPADDRRREGVVGTATQCSNGIDDDQDGAYDLNDTDCGGGGTSEFAPGVIPPAVPVPMPDVPGTSVPTVSSVPGTPSTTTTPSEIPDTPILPQFPDGIIPTITTTVVDIFQGEVELPEARDRVIAVFIQIVEWFKALFERMANVVEIFVYDDTVRAVLSVVAVVGLAVLLGVLVLQFTIVPVAGRNELFLFPYLVWQNIQTLAGAGAVKPWGVVYDSSTHTPLALAHVSIIDRNGRVMAGVITAPDGSFSASVPDGEYTLRIDAHNTMLPIVATAPLLYEYVHTADQSVLIVSNQPAQPFDVAVRGETAMAPVVTPVKEFFLYHEVSLTNLSFVLFGVGMLSAMLCVIFFPGAITLAIFLLYVGIALLRVVGVFGSYASVFLKKSTEAPIVGKVVTIFNKHTNLPVAKTLTSAYGRAYLPLPEGYFYTTISTPDQAHEIISTTMMSPFATHTGLYRKRFLL